MKKIALAFIAVAVLSIGACKKDEVSTPKKGASDIYKDNTGWDVEGGGNGSGSGNGSGDENGGTTNP